MPPRLRKTAQTQSSSNVQQNTTATTDDSTRGSSGRMPAAGVSVCIHPVWPDMQFSQGELFFECTLFLYSVLALFLQYLNLYKTLWWLPKSYWHYSMKFHMINPYFLSCVGLLLGWRVTTCFWKTITDVFGTLMTNSSEFMQGVLNVIEYAIIKTPLMTLIITSFLFSFSRVCHDFPLQSVMYVFCPVVVYGVMFCTEIWGRAKRVRRAVGLWLKGHSDFTLVIDRLSEPPPSQLDLDTVLHMCSLDSEQIQQEVDLLLDDMFLRLKRSAYAGFSTAFLSIALPCFFVPYKTNLGLPLTMLVDETWEWELAIVVFLTAFSLYFTYLLPLNYLDLLHRSALHLGVWEQVEPPRVGQTGPQSWAPQPWIRGRLYDDGCTVSTADGRCYRARSSHALNTVAADPSRPDHATFFGICSRPCTLINTMCIFELVLIVVQFWMLVLTTDWQHIVTLVLLMFANYLLLAKLFKDKVIMGRIYEPSPEDMTLVAQLLIENRSLVSQQQQQQHGNQQGKTNTRS